MSGKELLEEYESDLSYLRQVAKKFDDSVDLSDDPAKLENPNAFAYLDIVETPRNNMYLSIIKYSKITENDFLWNFEVYHIGLFKTEKGIWGVLYYQDGGQAIRFTPHFFERYRERYSKLCDERMLKELNLYQHPIALMGLFMLRNINITWMETRSVFRDKVHIFAPVNDGVVLLQWSKNRRVLQANTFVTYDMLDERQNELVRMANIYLSLPKKQRKKFQLPDFLLQND